MGGGSEVDLTDVAGIDEIGVNVLCSARQRAYEQGTALTVEAPSLTVGHFLSQNGF